MTTPLEGAKQVQQESGQTLIHAFNDLAVIAGQGTVGLEILQELERRRPVLLCRLAAAGLSPVLPSMSKKSAPCQNLWRTGPRRASGLPFETGPCLQETREA